MQLKFYDELDPRIHQLAQTLTKFNRTFVKHQSDDSHTNIALDYAGEQLLGHWADTDYGKVMGGIHLPSQTFRLVNDCYKPLLEISAVDTTQKEWEHNISSGLSDLGWDTNGLLDPLHFEISEYPFADDRISTYATNALQEWMELRELANTVCLQVKTHLQHESEIRIWPHHFDTGIYLEVTEEQAFGFGLAMKDPLIGCPYLYFTSYPLNGQTLKLPDVRLEVGSWLTKDGYSGAVLPMVDFRQNDLPVFVCAVADAFLGQ